MKKELELYIHIPFCVKKCVYCDFLSAPSDEKTRKEYVEALLKEIEGRASFYKDYEVTAIFIGGGTPSILDGEDIEKILSTIRVCFDVIHTAEITIECNPGTIDEKKLLCYKQAGINRISFGLQAVTDQELRMLGRIHNYQVFLEGYQLATSLGYQNINVDLMSGIPGQSLAMWQNTLQTIMKLEPRPSHISVYSLILEEGTPLYRKVSEGELKLVSEEEDREIYHCTNGLLENFGYHQYEISNYAMDGFECQHNLGYWRRKEYLGLGIGAASLVSETRFQNDSQLEKYIIDPLNQQISVEKLSLKEQMEEFIFLGLRTIQGISKQAFREAFQSELSEVFEGAIEKHIRNGLLCWDEDEEWLRLTRKGLDLLDYITLDFML